MGKTNEMNNNGQPENNRNQDQTVASLFFLKIFDAENSVQFFSILQVWKIDLMYLEYFKRISVDLLIIDRKAERRHKRTIQFGLEKNAKPRT